MLVSTSAFKFILRQYTLGTLLPPLHLAAAVEAAEAAAAAAAAMGGQTFGSGGGVSSGVVVDGRGLHSSTTRLNMSTL